jgi:hypothetical protein
VTATFLRSAANNARVAADILASHVDPINGRRTPQGAAIRLGAGRSAALAEFAVVMTEFANVDRPLAAWLDSGARSQSRGAGVIHGDMIEALRSWARRMLAAAPEAEVVAYIATQRGRWIRSWRTF